MTDLLPLHNSGHVDSNGAPGEIVVCHQFQKFNSEVEVVTHQEKNIGLKYAITLNVSAVHSALTFILLLTITE